MVWYGMVCYGIYFYLGLSKLCNMFLKSTSGPLQIMLILYCFGLSHGQKTLENCVIMLCISCVGLCVCGFVVVVCKFAESSFFGMQM